MSFEVDNPGGLTINPALNQIVTYRIFLINGGITHANKITLGYGGTSTAFVQVGSQTVPAAPGVLDAAPVFNPGSGGVKMYYFNTASPYTTGFEITPARTVKDFVLNNIGGNQVTLTGGDLTVTGSAVLTNGRLTTGVSTFIVANTATFSGTLSGYVDGALRQTFAATGEKIFHVGTGSGYSRTDVAPSAGTFPANVTVRATAGPQPNYPGFSLKRYWTINAPANMTADLTFFYQSNDDGTQDENAYVLARYNGSFAVVPAVINAPGNLADATGVNPLSGDWFLLEADNDFDGLPNSYEMAHTSPASATSLAANGDLDGDGTSNLAEYIAGTNPQNASSVLRITSVVKNGAGLLITFPAVAFKVYRLEYKNALTDPAWQFLSSYIPGAVSGTAQVTDASATGNPLRFYRLALYVAEQP